MVPRLAALALVLLLTGCTTPAPPAAPGGPATPPDGAAAPAEDGPVRFGAPVVVETFFAAEPATAVGPDGTLYVLVWTRLYGSRDGGATYDLLETPFDDPGDSDFAFGGNGSLHYVGMDPRQDAPNGALPYFRSTDGGATWSEPVALAPTGGAVDRQWIAARGDGLLVVAWRSFEDQGNYLRVSRDDGLTWEETQQPTEGGFFPGPVAVRGDLVLQPLGGNGIEVVRSTDHGRTFEVLAGPDLGGGRAWGFPTLAIDAAGTAYLAAAVDPAPVGTPVGAVPGAPRITLWASTDGGTTWGAPQSLGAAGATGVLPWVVAGAPGRVAVSFLENVLGTSPHAQGEWYATVASTADAAPESAAWDAVRAQSEPVRRGAICMAGTGCSAGTGVVGVDWSLRDLFEMSLTPEGRPFLAWVRDPAPVKPPVEVAGGGQVEVVAALAQEGWTAG